MNKLLNPELAGLDVKESELLIATAEGGDGMIDENVLNVLKIMRTRLGMDVVFVSEFVNDERTFKYVDADTPVPGVEIGSSAPLEESWCKRVVDGRLPEYIPSVDALPAGSAPKAPFPIGTHLSVPIRLATGEVYGTVCCFSHSANPAVQHTDLSRLRSAAHLVAIKLENARTHAVQDPWTLVDKQPRR